ncbi:unnamed protein product [Oppiella nova]|uniref:RNA polymerase II assembly factor Rtp1 C-terminal domain-containing protein n=1 Tax=Oppiella nova TaxID=334625 RepID=A0A7R9LDB1_9ACAR|nr:unnamed protein product [Oppiella nova]CAG2162476.1 unnamed protein product [Oppiella nova]
MLPILVDKCLVEVNDRKRKPMAAIIVLLLITHILLWTEWQFTAMDNIQEICGDLKTIAKLLSTKEATDPKIFDEIVAKVCRLCEDDMNCRQIYETIEPQMNELIDNQTLDDSSRHRWRIIDTMTRAIILLNQLSDEELISNQNFLTINQHFQRIQHLFLSVGDNSWTLTDHQMITYRFIYSLTTILIKLLNTKSIIGRILLEDCFASLIASLMSVRHDSGSDENMAAIDEELSALLTGFDQTIVIRNLLLLSRCQAIKWSNNEISRSLSKCLIRDLGLISLINAVIDCDQTSERQTTLNQRYQAIGTIVSAMPVLCCSLRQYYEIIGGQVLELMVSANQYHHTIGAIILMSLENRNQKLTQELIINKILDLFLTFKVCVSDGVIGIEFRVSCDWKMTFSPSITASLLTCALIDSIHESVAPILSNFPEKSIKFVINLFERLAAEQSIDGSVADNTGVDIDCHLDVEFAEMKRNSLIMCLQIVEILLKERDKLKNQDVIQLKQLIPTLDVLSKSQHFDEKMRKTAIDVRNRIELYANNGTLSGSDGKLNNDFELAMNEMNDPLMPVRAHALIKLKQLIYAKDRHLLDNRSQLINALKMCLNDSESYIYLSAVNTLSTLAILCTDDVLPVLIQEFSDSDRKVEDRVKVGEVLTRLSKSIGDFGHHYSKQYMSCFLNGLKSGEPAIRISSLSNLGQFCGALRFALKPYIVELMSAVEALLNTDESMEVKRSSVHFLHLMLKGVERDTIEAVAQQLKDIHRLLRDIRHKGPMTVDDILQLHAQLAMDEIDRIYRDLCTPTTSLEKNIKILSL